MPDYLYVGTYSKEIFVYEWKSGQLVLNCVRRDCENPSFGAFHPSGDVLYLVNEMEEDAYITAYGVNSDNGKIRFLNEVESPGHGLCHLCVLPDGRALCAAGYGSGHVVLCPITSDGRVGEVSDAVQHEGSSVNSVRQASPHAHCVIPFEGGVLCCDLGLDKLMLYDITSDLKLVPAAVPYLETPAGEGPRQALLHPSGQVLYVLTELKNNVLVYRKGPGGWSLWMTHTALPSAVRAESTAAQLQLSPDGRFLYASVRGSDTLCRYPVRPDGGLGEGEISTCPGRNPRMFALSPDGQYVFIGLQTDNRVAVMKRDTASGVLLSEVCEMPVKEPVWLECRSL